MEEFEVDDLFDGLPGPDYNVAPTVAVPAVFERRVKDTGEIRRRLARWSGGWCRPGRRTPRSARG